MSSIAVIGQGFVGGSISTVFVERGTAVYAYDKMGKLAHGALYAFVDWYAGKKAQSITDLVVACETFVEDFLGIYFVCLPTPMYEDGSADLSIVEGALAELASVPGERIAVVKSTVPPGSTERWNTMFNSKGLYVVFNPEFLREATAIDDMRDQNRIILGGPRPHINKVKQLFESAWPNVPVIKTSSTTAEMVKYVTNIHLAVKVSLANEFYQICQKLDESGNNIDYDKVIEYATLDERLGKSHWKVPGPMPADDTGLPAMGFAGSCITADAEVRMDGKVIPITELEVEFKKGTKILSANYTLENLDYRTINEVTSRHYKGKVIKFSVNGKTITSTPEHYFPVNRREVIQLVMAKDISIYDELFVFDGIDLNPCSINSIETQDYDGLVYNTHLASNEDSDDLFWVANDIVTHNCFIKDLNAMMALAKSLDVDPKTMSGAWHKNLEVRPQRDWEKLVGRAVSKKPNQ
jgi:UDP-glucose 6-dehydrogenase